MSGSPLSGEGQLHRLRRGFQFPDTATSIEGHKFSGDEVLLCGLYRLHFPNKFSDPGWQLLFGFDEKRASDCFTLFLGHLIANWLYLLMDHFDFWVRKIPSYVHKIRDKMAQLGCVFPANEFRVFAFIDNTMNATCRPAGGPARDGINAPRNDPIIQRTFYNGWKKLHGL